MSRIVEHALTARAVLRCDASGCKAEWESEVYRPKRWGDETRAAQPAFDRGWKLYNGSRSHRIYCPHHVPTVPMHMLHGPGVGDE